MPDSTECLSAGQGPDETTKRLKHGVRDASRSRLDVSVRSGSLPGMNSGSPRFRIWFAGWFYFGPANLRVGLP
ncbi:MAG TPA: hypothetical protein VEL06_10600 [Haliangiales bacterium]|nr:hypothetical protein [Haliangiales bacterium]